MLPTPETVTTTLPLDAPLGTGTTILVALQLVGLAAVPLNVTVLDPCVEPKLTPVIVTEAPTNADVGEMPRIPAEVSVKSKPLLFRFDTLTTTFPVIVPPGTGAAIWVLLQLVGVEVTPLNAIELDPCVEPKFVPVTVTDVPAGPLLGDRPVRFGTAIFAPML